MNRIYKFRAWDKENNLMLDPVDVINVYFFPINVELMQYTNLKDRTGREIFEGDIVEYEAQYDDEGLDMRPIREEVKFEGGAYQTLASMPSEEFEVIGNIYENPELLN